MVVDIITWAFAGMLATLVAVWLYAVVWMIFSWMEEWVIFSWRDE